MRLASPLRSSFFSPAHALIAAALLSVFCAAQTQADGGAPEFTLAGYIQAALDLSPEVRQARQAHATAVDQWKAQVAAAALPTLSLTGTAVPYGHSLNNGYRLNVWRLERQDFLFSTSLNLNLFNSFQDVLRVRQTSLGRDAAEAGLRAASQGRTLDALQAFYDLHLKLSLQDVAKQNLAAQEDQYRLTEDLYKNGMKSLSDLLKSETDWRSSELRMAAAEADAKSSLMRFNILLNREELSPVRLKASLEQGTTALPVVPRDLARALDQRPELRQARLAVERARNAVQQALQSALPSFTVNAAVSRTDLGPRSTLPNPLYQLGLGLSLPSGFNIASQYFAYRASVSERKRSEAALAQTERSVRNELFSAEIALERATKAYQISSQKETIADKNLAIVNERYKQGSADVITLAQAQLDFLNAQVERAQALNDTFVQRALYKYATGDPLW